MKKFIIATAALLVISGSAFAAQSEEGMNNRDARLAMNHMMTMLKHEMMMTKRHMADLTRQMEALGAMEAGGNISRH